VNLSKLTALFLVLFLCSFSFAAVTPTGAGTVDPQPSSFQKIKAKDVEKITGKKLTLLQKAYLGAIQNRVVRKLLKLGDEPITERQKKLATASLILGIASLALLFIPYVGILAIPAGILAIIFGAKSTRGNSNVKGIIGIVTGGVTLLIFLIAIIWLFAFFSGGWF